MRKEKQNKNPVKIKNQGSEGPELSLGHSADREECIRTTLPVEDFPAELWGRFGLPGNSDYHPERTPPVPVAHQRLHPGSQSGGPRHRAQGRPRPVHHLLHPGMPGESVQRPLHQPPSLDPAPTHSPRFCAVSSLLVYRRLSVGPRDDLPGRELTLLQWGPPPHC